MDPNKRARLLEAAVPIAAARVGEIEVVRATGIDHDAMPALVASCDAVACTSKGEGWPNSVKEALASGLPFVSTDVSDLRMIADIEPSCRIAAADPIAFADALCAVLTQTSLPPLRHHVEPMDLAASSRRLLSLYERLVKS
jgi:glycosyltransferase involved in cell wall biosynthesis